MQLKTIIIFEMNTFLSVAVLPKIELLQGLLNGFQCVDLQLFSVRFQSLVSALRGGTCFKALCRVEESMAMRWGSGEPDLARDEDGRVS